MPRNPGSPFNINSIFESLEERVLFDGVPDATFILPQADAAEPVPAQVQNVEQSNISGVRELVLVDSGVENSEALLSEILESKPDATIEIRVIDSGSDGVAQISAILAESDAKYDAIHIISHGDEGELNLGNTALTAGNLNSYVDQLAGWSDALTADADLLFYGCELAGNAEGQAFIETISAVTGADVAASDDLTGAAELGGDWDLEVTSGTVETSALQAKTFGGTLNLIEVARFNGQVDVAVTGGAFRSQSDADDATALNTTASGELSLPPGVTADNIVSARLFWTGSGGPDVAVPADNQVTLNGVDVTAELTYADEFDQNEQFFGASADVTEIVRSSGAGIFTVGELQVDTGGNFATFSTIQAGFTLSVCLLYTSPSPRDQRGSRMPSSA